MTPLFILTAALLACLFAIAHPKENKMQLSGKELLQFAMQMSADDCIDGLPTELIVTEANGDRYRVNLQQRTIDRI